MKNKITILALLVSLSITSGCAAQSSDSEFRFWTTSEGRKSSVKLKVVEQTENKVKLEREDSGKVIVFDLDKLSKADQAWLEKNSMSAESADDQSSGSSASENWARFRGPSGLGTSSDTNLPLKWSDSKNIVWKTPLKGKGSSSPITWGDHIYLTCYTGYGLDQKNPGNINDLTYHMLCFHRSDGKLSWEKEIASEGKVAPFEGQALPLHGYATSTPVADETGVYVLFGPTGLARYSHQGDRKWLKPIGDYEGTYGDGSSPIIYKDRIIVHAVTAEDHSVAVKKATGDILWDKNNVGCSWHTPVIARTENRDVLVTSRRTWGVAGIDPMTGEDFWWCESVSNMTAIPVPIVDNGIAYFVNGREGNSRAVRLGGKGKVGDSHIVWAKKNGTEMSSPVLHDGHLYYVSSDRGGIAHCVDASNGEVVYRERLQPDSGKVYASAVVGDGKIYYVSRENGTFVVTARPQFEQLAHNVLESDDSVINATPAISRGQLLIRSDKFLYCIGK